MTYLRIAAFASLVLSLGFSANALDRRASMPRAAGQGGALKWYKGNTHTHTLNSDGDSSPDEVVRWYRENRYHFVVLTDHNYLTSVESLNALMGADERFLVVKGEEVSDAFGGKPLHINGLNVARVVAPQGGTSAVDVVQRNVDAIRAAEGVPHINHPNFHWALSADELAQVKNTKLFEIFNGHPRVNNVGGGGAPGLEEMWDRILSTGVLIYGIAVDDAHVFKRPEDRAAAWPGQGWVVVRASRLGAAEILEAMERGDFYASTGVELSDYVVTAEGMTVTVVEETGGTAAKYRVQFVGRGGKVLAERTVSPERYEFVGNEGYVRAKVMDSNGRVAWTQPVRVGKWDRAAKGSDAGK